MGQGYKEAEGDNGAEGAESAEGSKGLRWLRGLTGLISLLYIHILSYGKNTFGNKLYGFLGLPSKMSDWIGEWSGYG